MTQMPAGVPRTRQEFDLLHFRREQTEGSGELSTKIMSDQHAIGAGAAEPLHSPQRATIPSEHG